MDPMQALPVGRRIQYYRERRDGMTRAVLAGLLGKSESWLKAVESGRLQPPRLSVLARTAELLKVSVGDLAGGELTLPAETVTTPGHAALPAVRDAVNRRVVQASQEPPSPNQVQARVDAGWQALHASARHRTTLGELLPALLADAQSTVVALDGPERRRAQATLAGAFSLAQMYAAYQPDAALVWRITDRAFVAAQDSSDPAALAVALWYLLHVHRESGQWETAQDIANDGITMLDPLLPTGGDDLLALWGSLHLEAAVTAGRAGESDAAWRHWDEADRAARRLPSDYWHPQTSFGPGFMAPSAVTVAVELRQGGEAQRQANRADVPAIPSATRRGKKLVDVARGHWLSGDAEAVIGTLNESYEMAPETIQYNGWARQIVLDLLAGSRRERRRTEDLAEKVGLLT